MSAARRKAPIDCGLGHVDIKPDSAGPDLWLNLQKRYDLQPAEQELEEKIKAISTLEVA